MNTEIKKDKKKDKGFEPELHFIVFRLGAEEYGIRIEQVKEVTLTPDIAKTPGAPPFVKGVANIRGDIIAVMDLKERFRIREEEDAFSKNKTAKTYTLVIETSNYRIGLIVPEVPQSLSIPASNMDKTPNMIYERNIHDNYIEGIAKVNDTRLIIILDIFKLLTQDETAEIAQKTI